MGRAAGVARRRKKTANIRNRTRKSLKKVRKQQLKKTGGIACDEIREEWNMQRSSKTNMAKMGLSHDPNYSMARETREMKRQKMMDMLEEYTKDMKEPTSIVGKVQQTLLKEKRLAAKKKAEFEVTNMDEDNDDNNNDIEEDDGETEANNKSKKPKTKVIEALEKKASVPAPKNFRFGPDSINFCVYMIDKHDDHYEAMCRDSRNYYQESAGQIKAKIKKFEKIMLDLDQDDS